MNNFILKDCGGKTYVEECIQCEGREETVDVLYAPSSLKEKEKLCSYRRALICTSNTSQGFGTTSGAVKLI